MPAVHQDTWWAADEADIPLTAPRLGQDGPRMRPNQPGRPQNLFATHSNRLPGPWGLGGERRRCLRGKYECKMGEWEICE